MPLLLVLATIAVAVYIAKTQSPAAAFATRPDMVGVIGFSPEGLDAVRTRIKNWTVVAQPSEQSIMIAPGKGLDATTVINGGSPIADVWISSNVLAAPAPKMGVAVVFMPVGVLPNSGLAEVAGSPEMAVQGLAADGIASKQEMVFVLLLGAGERL